MGWNKIIANASPAIEEQMIVETAAFLLFARLLHFERCEKKIREFLIFNSFGVLNDILAKFQLI